MRLKQLALLLPALAWLCCVNAYGQTKDTVAKRSIMERIREISEKESKASIEDVEADRAAIIQYKVLEQIKAGMQKARLYLRNGIDTNGIKTEISLIKRDMDVAGDGVFTNKGTAQTFRNLSVTSKIFAELYRKSNSRRIKLESYHDALNTFRFQLDSLSANPALFKFGRDSASAIKYFKQLVLVAREISPIDSSLKEASDNVQTLLNDINTTNLSLQNNLDLIADYQLDMARNTFTREFNNIWQEVGYSRPMAEIIKYSIKRMC